MTETRSKLDLDFVESLRLAELQSAVAAFKGARTALEVGAGVGWQARELDRLGLKVEAVDLPDGDYSAKRIWPVRDYDGRHLPFDDQSFDLVFSSNVLEHVDDLHGLLLEQCRVLKDGGRMVHIVPSATWRVVTSATYYPYGALELLRRLFSDSKQSAKADQSSLPRAGNRKGIRRLWAPVHGVGTSVGEEWSHFRHRHWLSVFRAIPVVNISSCPADVLYSGHNLFGRAVPISLRRLFARIFGSSCHVFIMQKPIGRSPNA